MGSVGDIGWEVTTAGCVGWEVTTSGIPVMTPREFVNDVYAVMGLEYGVVASQVDQVDVGGVGGTLVSVGAWG
jgi:hypothetical protein